MGRRRRPMNLVNMSNRRTPVLKIFGNGSIVDTAGYKHQAEEAPSFKRQARATNCRASICPIDRSTKLQAGGSKLQAPRTTVLN